MPAERHSVVPATRRWCALSIPAPPRVQPGNAADAVQFSAVAPSPTCAPEGATHHASFASVKPTSTTSGSARGRRAGRSRALAARARRRAAANMDNRGGRSVLNECGARTSLRTERTWARGDPQPTPRYISTMFVDLQQA